MADPIFNRTVILSVDDNPNYFGYLPYTQKAWNHFGWNTLTFYLGNQRIDVNDVNQVVPLGRNAKYRDCSVVQVSRLLCGHFCEGLLMIGDVDMIPLSNYWNPSRETITCYRHYNSSGAQISMCYVAMSAMVWRQLIPERTVEALLRFNEDVLSTDFNRWWFTDQRILTARLGGRSHVDVYRASSKEGRALGRIDRLDWEGTFKDEAVKIDAHMVQPFNQAEVDRVMQLINCP
jgi:hypothetical protein